MELRTRTILSLLAALSAAVITALSLLRLTVPAVADWYAGMPPGLLDRVVDGGAAALIGLLTGVAGVVVSIVLLARARGAESPAALGVMSVVVTVAVLLLSPGGIIPVAGYTFALTALGIVIAGALLLAIRHPLVGIVVIGALVAVGVVAAITLDGAPLPAMLVTSLGEQLPRIAVTLAHLALAATIVLGAIGDGRDGRGRVARWVLAHRTAITVVAACCALPYAFVRATWLTPWPLFGGDRGEFTAHPDMLITGLMLGFGMLMAGVLTLGLVRPWGERFPRWFAGLGGRPVPVGLPVIAAMTVSVLFIAGGAEFIVQIAEGQFTLAPEAVLEFLVVFPFWLWGPTLGLAAWGYAMHRAGRGAVVDAEADVAPDAGFCSHGLHELELRESREA
ncbi:hypothetical protein L2X99_15935 [Microbacterium sp. KUDC0406]|uniref:hypothetical protein n=1 Tax=Microbacterium sp. KUDC0406 TaxID=2909588 RepID=UPI001F232F6B|nr:hypothetical protein [Microbacterium sp. KUDC0406]UJP09847.1 hypothetical protein L2X99_15935 [Microbacterium sp. KUDC0406]